MTTEAPPKTPTEELKSMLIDIKNGQTKGQDELSKLKKEFDELLKSYNDQKSALELLRKAQIKEKAENKRELPNGQFVSEGCAKMLGGILAINAVLQKKVTGNAADKILARAAEYLEIEVKTALTSSDILLPVNYSAEIVALFYKFGQARNYATVYPLGAAQTKLPKATTSPAFAIVAPSASVGEKVPQFVWATFTPQKCGALVRIPSEIEEDTLVALGNFLARYIAREGARFEDNVLFNAANTGLYTGYTGCLKYADTAGKKVQLVTTKTKPSDVAIADMRNLRTQIDYAAIGGSAYYMHPTMEVLLNQLNANVNFDKPYVPMGPNGPTFDGFPVRWVGTMPVYGTTAQINQYQIGFGDLSYWYFGERRGLDVQTSNEVFFATDEIGVRALERFDVQALNDNAFAVLQLAAS